MFSLNSPVDIVIKFNLGGIMSIRKQGKGGPLCFGSWLPPGLFSYSFPWLNLFHPHYIAFVDSWMCQAYFCCAAFVLVHPLPRALFFRHLKGSLLNS